VKDAGYLCEDYFTWTRPQIQSVFDIIKMCCKSDQEYFTNNQIDEAQKIIMKYCIKNNLPRDSASKYGP